MGSRRKVLVIRSFEATPQGGTVEASKAEIERLLSNTKPGDISGAGSAYRNAALAIDRAVAALDEHAASLAKAWKGPAAAQVQQAMQLMHASGVELSTKMKMMDDALAGYAQKLPETLAKVRDISVELPKTPEGSGGGTVGDAHTNALQQQASAQIPQAAKTAAENAQAQKAMRELNQKIVELLDVHVPMDVSYELPPFSIPSGGGPDQRTVNPGDLTYSGGQSASTTGGPGYEGVRGGGTTGGGSDGTGSAGPGGRGTGAGDSGTGGGRGSDGSGTGGPGSGAGPGGTGPGGTGPGGTAPGGTGPGGPGSEGTLPGAGSGVPGTDPSNSSTSNPDQITQHQTGDRDGTVPSVIGRDDPRATEAAGYTPSSVTTTAFTPTTGLPTTSIPTGTPTTLVPSTATPPGVPAVLGGPNSWGEQAGGHGSGRSGGAGTTGMYPFMPMGGTAGAGSDDSTEVGTNLSEDRDVWAVHSAVTEPRIG